MGLQNREMWFIRQYASFFIVTSWLFVLFNQYYLMGEMRDIQGHLAKMKEKLKSIEHRFSTHQVQEIMKKEEKASKQIHALKKQVKHMHDEHVEFDKHDMALHKLHGSKQSELLNTIESDCVDHHEQDDRFQTRRHSVYGNGIFICKTPHGDSDGVIGLIHHNVDDLEDKLTNRMLQVNEPKTIEDVEKNAANSTMRVLIVQDPLSRVLSAYGDDLLAKTGAKLTAWDDSKRAGFSEFMDYTISSGYRKDQRLHRQGSVCSVCSLKYTFVIKLEQFDQDMRELCHQLEVNRKETCDFLIEAEHDAQLSQQFMRNHRNLYATALKGIRPETIAEFVDIYKMDYEMFNYRKPAVLIDLGDSLLG